MTVVTRWMDRAWYPEYGSNWDDQMFRDRILAAIDAQSVVLDLGAGAGIVQHMNFRGIARRVCGIDLDRRVLDNPLLDEARLADATSIPYGDCSFDVVFADNVVEHLESPIDVFREAARVLRPDGFFFIKTPNKRHYMPAIAALTPHSFHRLVNRLRGRAHVDTFPTRYRANTPGAIRGLARASGLVVERIDLMEGRPEYLRMTAITYLVGAGYERLVNAIDALAAFRIVLLACLRKRLSA